MNLSLLVRICIYLCCCRFINEG